MILLCSDLARPNLEKIIVLFCNFNSISNCWAIGVIKILLFLGLFIYKTILYASLSFVNGKKTERTIYEDTQMFELK